jgi:hypothetical protein
MHMWVIVKMIKWKLKKSNRNCVVGKNTK